MIRTQPLRRTGRIAAKPTRPRKWLCSHCRTKNEPGKRKCSSCSIGRSTKRTSLKARCDSLARELCRLLAKGLCARCGIPGRGDWAHRMVRKHHTTRWDMDNCDYLCRPCHDFFGRNPMSFARWLVEVKGVDVDALERRANSQWDKDYTRVIRELQAQLRAAKEPMTLRSNSQEARHTDRDPANGD